MMEAVETVEGCPSFVKWTADGEAINWWSPSRTGGYLVDYLAGGNLFATTIEMLISRDPSRLDFYRTIMPPMNDDPRIILMKIIEAMEISGPTERGFIDALAAKAITGRVPPDSIVPDDLSDERAGEDYARACISVGHMAKAYFPVSVELVEVIDRTFIGDGVKAFVWTVCAAALAGALH